MQTDYNDEVGKILTQYKTGGGRRATSIERSSQIKAEVACLQGEKSSGNRKEHKDSCEGGNNLLTGNALCKKVHEKRKCMQWQRQAQKLGEEDGNTSILLESEENTQKELVSG